MEIQKYKSGTFCWPELCTSDSEGAKKFYKTIFGWDIEDTPVTETDIYSMAMKQDKSVGALYQMREDQKQQGVPPHWLSYVSVDDLENTVDKAKSLGGAAIVEPMDVMDVGRMAVLTDPTGAAFALWQPKQHIGAQLANEPGALTWNELMTTDTEKAAGFYTDLFEWGSESANMGGMMYTSFMNGDRPAGGMLKIAAEWGDVPPNWVVYFAVEDCDATAEQIKTEGGQILAGPQDIPEVGRFAMATDPQGAAFAVIKLANPPA